MTCRWLLAEAIGPGVPAIADAADSLKDASGFTMVGIAVLVSLAAKGNSADLIGSRVATLRSDALLPPALAS